MSVLSCRLRQLLMTRSLARRRACVCRRRRLLIAAAAGLLLIVAALYGPLLVDHRAVFGLDRRRLCASDSSPDQPRCRAIIAEVRSTTTRRQGRPGARAH